MGSEVELKLWLGDAFDGDLERVLDPPDQAFKTHAMRGRLGVLPVVVSIDGLGRNLKQVEEAVQERFELEGTAERLASRLERPERLFEQIGRLAFT